MNAILEEEYRGYTIKVYQDEYPENPREWDNFGTMVCWHGNYILGDEQPNESPEEYFDDINAGNAIVLPLYLYDHSGITMNTTGFSCPWDSGQVGRIYVTKEKIRKEYGVKRISPQLKKNVVSLLRSEVETYDQYLRGEVYGFMIEDGDGEHVDSCWGFFGDPNEYMMSECRGIIDYTVDKKRKEHLNMLKTWIKNHVPYEHRHAMEVAS